MVIVDSCVWIDYFANRITQTTEKLDELLVSRQAVIGDLIAAEVLKGVRTDQQFTTIARLFDQIDQITISDHETATAAARHYRHLRSLGITPRGTIDALIAARCIADGLQLLTSDRDFDPFVTHLGLQSA
jgi:predicted nucleic acid-binding protein